MKNLLNSNPSRMFSGYILDYHTVDAVKLHYMSNLKWAVVKN